MKVILPLPPTTNSTYKVGNGRMYKSKDASDWRTDAFYTIKQTLHERFKEKVKVTMLFYTTALSLRDIDGSIKTILDVLQETQVVINDRQVRRLWVDMETTEVNQRVEVTIEAIP